MNKREQSRTILLIRNAAKSDFGGAETYSVSLAKILKKNGFSPVIVTRSEKLLSYAHSHKVQTIRGWWWSKQTWNGLNIAIFPAYLAWQCVLTLWYVRLIKKIRPLALHIQSKDDFIAATIAGKLTGTQTIWTDHMDLRFIFKNIKKPLRNPLGKLVYWAAKHAGHIIIIADNEYRLVTSEFKDPHSLDEQIVVIKNGVIDELKNVKPRTRDKNKFIFCVASRMVKLKGVGEAIRAFIKLRETAGNKAKHARLAIYGDGPDIQKFKDLAKGRDDITFYGHQQNSIQKIYESDAFVFPTYREGFSITLLEATMLGKVIIVSDVDSTPEVVTHKKTGLLVPVGDIDALAEAMDLVISNSKLRKTLEVNARKNYEQNFNLETIVREKIIPLYFD